jgi:hypothetical protein
LILNSVLSINPALRQLDYIGGEVVRERDDQIFGRIFNLTDLRERRETLSRQLATSPIDHRLLLALTGATNANGGTLILAPGLSTSSGSSGITFEVYGPGSSGTAGNSPTVAASLTPQSRFGIQTASPDEILSLGGAFPQIFDMVRSTSLNIGNSLTIHSGGAAPGGTNQPGGNLILSSGISTGNGASQIQFQVYPPGSSGTADNSPVTAMTIAGSALGLGTATPQSLVHAYGGEVQVGSSGASCAAANNGAIRFSSSTLYVCTGTTWTAIGGSGGSGTVTSSTAGQVAYYQSTGSTVIGTSTLNVVSGNVGIGVTSPAYTLDVGGIVNASSATAGVTVVTTNTNGSSSGAMLANNTGSNYYCYIAQGSYSLSCNGPTSGVSDQRLKKEIRPLDAKEGLTAIMKLQPVHYLWKDERMNKAHPGGDIGFTAQNVEGVLPDLVGETDQPEFATTKLPGGKQKGLQYDRISAPIVLAIQQQQAEIDELKQTIAQLTHQK